jgi:alpha-N-arabinofuranosidase
MGAAGVRAPAAAAPLIPPERSNSNRARLTVVGSERLGTISRNIYGHFAEHLGGCIYGAMWVGDDSSILNDHGLRRDTIAALKRIQAPIIRWPGGCFADAYHWRDGIGPHDKRPRTWNITWNRDESNAFGTDEYLAYCQRCGASPYICMNVGSGTVQEAVEWMEYCNGSHATTIAGLRAANGNPDPYNVRYWSVGNENWGCGGWFDAASYARQYLRFFSFLGRAAWASRVEFVACGDLSGDWNQKLFETMLERANRIVGVQHLSVHHYFHGGPGVNFSDEEYYGLLAGVGTLEALLGKTIGVIDSYTKPGGPPIGIALDEWGVWHPSNGTGATALLQPNTLRDALLAAVVLNGLNNLASRISMANIAQTFNVLQCMAFTRGSDMVLTPTYYAFDLFQPHMDAVALRTVVDSPTFTSQPSEGKVTRQCLSASASWKEGDRRVCLTLVNQHLTEALEADVELVDLKPLGGWRGKLRQLTSESVRDENTFEQPHKVEPSASKAISIPGDRSVQEIPPRSITSVVLRAG